MSNRTWNIVKLLGIAIIIQIIALAAVLNYFPTYDNIAITICLVLNLILMGNYLGAKAEDLAVAKHKKSRKPALAGKVGNCCRNRPYRLKRTLPKGNISTKRCECTCKSKARRVDNVIVYGETVVDVPKEVLSYLDLATLKYQIRRFKLGGFLMLSSLWELIKGVTRYIGRWFIGHKRLVLSLIIILLVAIFIAFIAWFYFAICAMVEVLGRALTLNFW